MISKCSHSSIEQKRAGKSERKTRKWKVLNACGPIPPNNFYSGVSMTLLTISWKRKTKGIRSFWEFWPYSQHLPCGSNCTSRAGLALSWKQAEGRGSAGAAWGQRGQQDLPLVPRAATRGNFSPGSTQAVPELLGSPCLWRFPWPRSIKP